MPKFLNKLITPRMLPAPIVDALVWSYEWGFSDAKEGIEKKTPEQIKESLNRGFKQGVKQSGDLK